MKRGFWIKSFILLRPIRHGTRSGKLNIFILKQMLNFVGTIYINYNDRSSRESEIDTSTNSGNKSGILKLRRSEKEVSSKRVKNLIVNRSL